MQSNAYAGLQVNEYSRFQQVWILPKVLKNAMINLKTFVAINQANCTYWHWLVLLAVTFLDRKKEILVLAKNQANCLWFLEKTALYLT